MTSVCATLSSGSLSLSPVFCSHFTQKGHSYTNNASFNGLWINYFLLFCMFSVIRRSNVVNQIILTSIKLFKSIKNTLWWNFFDYQHVIVFSLVCFRQMTESAIYLNRWFSNGSFLVHSNRLFFFCHMNKQENWILGRCKKIQKSLLLATKIL